MRAGTQQLLAIFADEKWTKVRSSAPMLSWIRALRQEVISIIPGDTATRSIVIAYMFRNLGMRGHSFPSLQYLCLVLALTLYTVTHGASEGAADHIFTETDPFPRENVSFGTDASELDCSVTHINPHTLVTKNGVTLMEEVTGRHIGTVDQGRWSLLATVYDTGYMIRALPQPLSGSAQITEDEHSRGVPPSLRASDGRRWLGICRAFQADVLQCRL